jgi:hypothetical protein
MSPPHRQPSPPSSHHAERSLRRGSVSASDPYGKHLDINVNPTRTISSKLTIVRVEPQQTEQEPPRSSSPQQFRDRRQHKRHGSNSSVGSNQGESGRLSFAFTAFGPTNGSNGGRSSPTSGRTTPGSPGGPSPQQRKIPSFSRPRLAPEQVIELAKSSTHPKPSPSNNLASSIPASVSAPNFTPLPDDVYLPFIDRPAEVSALISTPPTVKLFTLLTQAFPLNARQPDDKVTLEDFAEKDPKSWTHAQLEYWFRRVDRDVASDEEWAIKARACVHSHSELLWERIKGALGIPPELDISEGEMEEDEIGGLDASVTDFVLSPVDTTHRAGLQFGRSHHQQLPRCLRGRFRRPPDLDRTRICNGHQYFPVTRATSRFGRYQRSCGRGSREHRRGRRYKPTTTSKQEEVVHGLRISTSFSSPASHIHGNTHSALTSPIVMGSGGGGGAANSEGSYTLRRSNSSSSSIHIDGRLSPYVAYKGAHDGDCHAGIERGPGNPLFPSNFANLATGPTLRPK